MSLFDRVRTTVSSTVTATRGSLDGWRERPPAVRVFRAGAVSVIVPWLSLVVLAVVVWAATPGGDVPWWQVLGIASAAWFLGTGGAVAIDGVVVGLVPLLVWGLAAWFTAYQLRRLSAHVGEPNRALLPGFAGGYAAAAALVGLLTLAGPARPTVAGALGAVSVPVVAVLAVTLRVWTDAGGRIPAWVIRAARPTLWGAGALAGLSAVLLVTMVLVRWPTVSSLHTAVGAEGIAAFGLVVGQLMFVPDLMVWALSFLAGPGFQVAAGGAVTVSGASPGLLPMIPALGVVPADGHYPAWVSLALLLPVAVGGLIAWRAGAQWVRLARWRDKARTTGAAVLAVDLIVLGAALLASGPVGSGRMVHLGPPPWALAGALLAELALGAALAMGTVAVRRRWLG